MLCSVHSEHKSGHSYIPSGAHISGGILSRFPDLGNACLYISQPEAGFGSAPFEKLPFMLGSSPVLTISSYKIETGITYHKGHESL